MKSNDTFHILIVCDPKCPTTDNDYYIVVVDLAITVHVHVGELEFEGTAYDLENWCLEHELVYHHFEPQVSAWLRDA